MLARSLSDIERFERHAHRVESIEGGKKKMGKEAYKRVSNEDVILCWGADERHKSNSSTLDPKISTKPGLRRAPQNLNPEA